MSNQVEDRRKLPIFIHSVIDDMTDITPNTMRVYMHLTRRAGKDGFAFPSYQSIGDHCFGSVSDNSSTRRSMARKAIAELIFHKLIEKRARIAEDGDSDSNGYILLDVGVPIDTGMPNKHTGVPNKHTGVPIGTKDTPIEGTPLEDERLSYDNCNAGALQSEPLFELPQREMKCNASLAQMTPTSPQKPKRPRTENQQQQVAWVEAFAYALEFDAKIPGNYARWAKIGKGYAAAGYVPDDIRTWKDVRWPADWRCDKGQRPTKQALDDGIPDIKRRREAATRPKQLRNIIDSAGNIVGQVDVAV